MAASTVAMQGTLHFREERELASGSRLPRRVNWQCATVVVPFAPVATV